MVDPGAVTSAPVFLAVRNYIEATYGPGSFRAVRDAVAAAFPDFPHIFVPGHWYPTAAYLLSIEKAGEIYGPDDFYERCGRAIVDYEINVFRRFALRFTSPAWVVGRATEEWRSSHSTGRWQTTSGRGQLSGRLLDFEVTPHFCRVLTAYLETLLRKANAPDLRVTHPSCRARNDASCLYVSTWSEK